ncbi:hypothetical protein BGX27_002462 [Mortierella sp. AM989]|nr:hypothetical protein BGX27_002462 [Mortierella sp. AM989]
MSAHGTGMKGRQVPISIKLTPGALKWMQEEFARNYKTYNGDPWVLTTGTNVDEAIYLHTLSPNVESSLHSFMIDTKNGATLKALNDIDDQELIKTLNKKEQPSFGLNFDGKSTFGDFAAVDPLLNDFRTLPVTLKTLYEFKTDNAWSGFKVGEFVFHQLYNGQHKINKAEVQSCMEEALKQCKDKPCKILDIVGQILNVMAEEEGAPVSKEVNKHLTELAPKLSSEIWTLNKDKVLPTIVKRIDEILR